MLDDTADVGIIDTYSAFSVCPGILLLNRRISNCLKGLDSVLFNKAKWGQIYALVSCEVKTVNEKKLKIVYVRPYNCGFNYRR